MALKWVLRGLLALAALALLAGGGAWLYARTSLPKLNGAETLGGIGAKVEIVRDRQGVPHIFAESRADAYFGLGFVHAQDRLWQMELNRRVGSGRVAELVGATALDLDTFMRTLGLRRLAERRVARQSPEGRQVLEAYAAGVNAFLDSRKGALPPEFLALRRQPERWQPADSLVWLAAMALDLGGNWRSELLRLRLADRLNETQMNELFAPYPGTIGASPNGQGALYQELTRDPALQRLLALAPPDGDAAAGSNNWVVAGARTATGKPLLANDPHLRLGVPSLWYLAHLS